MRTIEIGLAILTISIGCGPSVGRLPERPESAESTPESVEETPAEIVPCPEIEDTYPALRYQLFAEGLRWIGEDYEQVIPTTMTCRQSVFYNCNGYAMDYPLDEDAYQDYVARNQEPQPIDVESIPTEPPVAEWADDGHPAVAFSDPGISTDTCRAFLSVFWGCNPGCWQGAAFQFRRVDDETWLMEAELGEWHFD